MIDFSLMTYRNLLDAMLSLVSNSFDKRDTSPIQTALGPAAYALEDFFLALNAVQQGSFITSASGYDLDALAVIGNLTRESATYAVRKGVFNQTITLGDRFSTIGDNSINFTATKYIGTNSDGNEEYELTAETAGVIGNEYTGSILPIQTIAGLTLAELTDIIIPGDDTESDDELRQRLIDTLNTPAFGGNIAAYKEFVRKIDGVGDLQVYPTWNGGGTVKLSVIGSDWLPATSAVVDNVQTAVDPNVNNGIGLGMAPIGATVTVVAPTTTTIDVTASLLLETGFTPQSVQTGAEAAVEAYLLSVRKRWAENVSSTGVQYACTVYRSQMIAALVSVEGVINVQSLLINGSALDVSLTETATTQEVPVKGTVTIS